MPYASTVQPKAGRSLNIYFDAKVSKLHPPSSLGLDGDGAYLPLYDDQQEVHQEPARQENDGPMQMTCIGPSGLYAETCPSRAGAFLILYYAAGRRSEERVLPDLTHLPNATNVELVVDDEDIGILATSQSTLAVVHSHDVGRSLTGHADSVFEGHFGLLHHGTNKAVGGGNGACQSRTVAQLAHAILDDHAGRGS